MQGPVRGETNSPDASPARMVRIRQVQEAHKGCVGRLALRCWSVGAKRKLIDTLRRRRIRRVIARTRKAREGRSGEDRAKAFVGGPRGSKPKGGSGGRRIKTPHDHKGLPRGKGLVTNAHQAGLTLRRQNNC